MTSAGQGTQWLISQPGKTNTPPLARAYGASHFTDSCIGNTHPYCDCVVCGSSAGHCDKAFPQVVLQFLCTQLQNGLLKGDLWCYFLGFCIDFSTFKNNNKQLTSLYFLIVSIDVSIIRISPATLRSHRWVNEKNQAPLQKNPNKFTKKDLDNHH